MRFHPWKVATATFAIATAALVPFAIDDSPHTAAAADARAVDAHAQSALVRELRAAVRNAPQEEEAILDELEETTSPGTIRRLVERLGWVGSDESVPVLSARASDRRLGIGAVAVTALGRIGSDASIAALRELIDVPSMPYRAEAVTALSESASESAYAALVDYALDPTFRLRSIAIDALGRTGRPDAVSVLERLADSSATRQWALYALAESGDSGAEQFVDDIARTPGAEGRADAIRLLPDASTDDAVAMLEAALESGREDEAGAAAEALSSSPNARAVPALVDCLTDGRPRVRTLCASALASRPSADARDALRAAIGAGDASLAQTAVYALANDASPDAVEILRSVVHDGSRMVRYAAVEALGAAEGPEADAILLDLAGDGLVELRRSAIVSLMRRQHPDALGLALEVMSDGSALEREGIVQSLAYDGGSEGRDALVDLARAGTAADWRMAITALAGCRASEPAVVALMQESLDSDDWAAALMAAQSLADGGDARARAVLEDIAHPTRPRSRAKRLKR